MEPNLHEDVTAALYSPDAGTVVPYEFAIALCENAVDNGVELLLKTQVVGIERDATADVFNVRLHEHASSSAPMSSSSSSTGGIALAGVALIAAAAAAALVDDATVRQVCTGV